MDSGLTSYRSALEKLFARTGSTAKFGLDRTKALLALLGNPHERIRSFHVAGTNGKGSVIATLDTLLRAKGMSVGRYTSPHLVDFRERIRVNGEMIGEAAVAGLTEQMRSHCGTDLVPTFFECTTAMALQHFADAHVDVAVLEVGLGGQFDATNVVTPTACAITTIALDHQEYLGTTLSSIAFEKAGIIKSNVPVVVGRIEEEAWHRIEQVATERHAPLARLDRDFFAEGQTPNSFSYRGRAVHYEGLTIPLEGRHQLDNAACALALIEAATTNGLEVLDAAVRQGLRVVHWEGRLEIVDRHPTVMLDGAHNPAASAVLATYLKDYARTNPQSRVILVWGMMRDKDHRGFAAPLVDAVDDLILTQAHLPRSATVADLHGALVGHRCCPRAAPILSEAIALARRLAAPDDLICVTGSLMLVGEMKALVRGCGLSPIRG